MTKPLISIILPVHNQQDHIRETIEEYQRELCSLSKPYELLLVTNACTDGTVEVCRSLETDCSSVRVVDIKDGGWGRAVRYGLEHARGETICYTNSARTSARDLLLLLMYASTYPDVVVKANRKIRDNWRRRLGSLLYNLECRALFDLSNWDINGTPKVFPREFSQLLDLQSNDDLVDAEFSAVCRRMGYPMIEVPIFSSRRHGGRSTTSLKSAIGMYAGALRLWRTMRRGTLS